ncbi:hypothetical protein MY04_0846 [Flammeovirga sp. MY04]|uniref:hypothetical protein n=1 Tax=Flammeovirga sp. MY04 TaxID=1191459 RepID=UPI0013050AD6|nr:hypothetical protein [Flammeovirga sp. MY04]ANQ48228.2 hypothetical protein MY04_0846 [Flammeovirga sp. MY04]
MKLKLISIIFFTVITNTFSQTDPETSSSELDENVIVIQSPHTIKTSVDDIEEGLYEVIKIDELTDFYLIFIRNDESRKTIYSEKILKFKGVKIEVGKSYIFKLFCKDAFDDGTCVPTVMNVTYFNKYTGADLGELKKAQGLVGLMLD